MKTSIKNQSKAYFSAVKPSRDSIVFALKMQTFDTPQCFLSCALNTYRRRLDRESLLET